MSLMEFVLCLSIWSNLKKMKAFWGRSQMLKSFFIRVWCPLCLVYGLFWSMFNLNWQIISALTLKHSNWTYESVLTEYPEFIFSWELTTATLNNALFLLIHMCLVTSSGNRLTAITVTEPAMKWWCEINFLPFSLVV